MEVGKDFIEVKMTETEVKNLKVEVRNTEPK
jgi:hypothetical protein